MLLSQQTKNIIAIIGYIGDKNDRGRLNNLTKDQLKLQKMTFYVYFLYTIK